MSQNHVNFCPLKFKCNHICSQLSLIELVSLGYNGEYYFYLA